MRKVNRNVQFVLLTALCVLQLAFVYSTGGCDPRSILEERAQNKCQCSQSCKSMGGCSGSCVNIANVNNNGGCQEGWFGSSCQYKCRCSGSCNKTDGSCQGDGRCQGGWFGPACQYADVAYRTSSLTNLTDGDDNTCIAIANQTVTTRLNASNPFTWLRVTVENLTADHLENITILFTTNTSTTTNCSSMKRSRVSKTTMDMHCTMNENIQAVTLQGYSVRKLCSLYVSGGRNIALNQPSKQSSEYTEKSTNNTDMTYSASLAVDGSTNQEFCTTPSCTHTMNTTNPSWWIQLLHSFDVNKYVIYNRNNNKERLQNFTLESFDDHNQSRRVFNYTYSNPLEQLIYTLTSPVPITIKSTHISLKNGILTLCEVEIYGDTNCSLGSYGRECENTCNCYNGDSCFVSTGGCPSGCAAGYKGEECNLECDSWKYGLGCQYNCSSYCKAVEYSTYRVCDHEQGHCINGCREGYQGPLCNVKVQALPDTNDRVPTITFVFPVVAVLILIVSFIVFMFRRRARKDPKANTDIHQSDANSSTSNEKCSNSTLTSAGFDGRSRQTELKRDVNDTQSNVYNDTSSIMNSTVVSVLDLVMFLKVKDREFFQKQFNAIPQNEDASSEVGLSPENKQKNRYKNIPAFDHSRVRLTPQKDLKGDYINASYVRGFNNIETFIASQGPTKAILNDFVRMLWEQKVEKVVMLTNLVENTKEKCERYWPEEGEMKVGEITVKLTTTQVFADYTIRRLQLRKLDHPAQNILHFHFTSWPDKDVPSAPWGLVDFEQRVASYTSDKPVVIHCSAGVGRTGTFIALRNVMREAEETGRMDFFRTVKELRQDRINMVQTLDQYIFLHQAAQVALLCIGTSVTLSDAKDRIQSLETKTKNGQTKMELEFLSICEACDNQEETAVTGENTYTVYENSQTLMNRLKNRYNNVLPKEMYSPKLTSKKSKGSSYINAVLVPSFHKPNHQILTQLPLPTTVTDFWRLVTQYQVSLVVALYKDSTTPDETLGDYLPSNENESANFSEFIITSEAVTKRPLGNQQELEVKVSTGKSRESWNLTHLRCSLTGLDPKQILSITELVRSRRLRRQGTVLFMCRNGAEYSGLICILTLLLDRMDNDHHLTVPLVVGAVKEIRPQVIPTLEQYQLLYHVLKLYSESINEYSNFSRSLK